MAGAGPQLLRALRGYYFNFKNSGPELAGYEEPVVRGVIRDAVEHGLGVGVLIGSKQAGEIDPTKDFSGDGRDARDAVRVPDVRVDFSAHIFELVELGNGRLAVFDHDAARYRECHGIEEAQCGGAVAQDEAAAVLRESPAFAVVVEGAQLAKTEAVIDKAGVRQPGELHECAAPVGEPFSKIFARNGNFLLDVAGIVEPFRIAN